MKTDRTTKLLLLIIALGLWLNLVGSLLIPIKARADEDSIESRVANVEHDVHSIYSGICLNSKIC
jgi:hypothetical protein